MSRAIRLRAIRGAWAIARSQGVARSSHPLAMDSIMDTDDRVRKAIVRAWEVGYRNGVKDARKANREGSSKIA